MINVWSHSLAVLLVVHSQTCGMFCRLTADGNTCSEPSPSLAVQRCLIRPEEVFKGVFFRSFHVELSNKSIWNLESDQSQGGCDVELFTEALVLNSISPSTVPHRPI